MIKINVGWSLRADIYQDDEEDDDSQWLTHVHFRGASFLSSLNAFLPVTHFRLNDEDLGQPQKLLFKLENFHFCDEHEKTLGRVQHSMPFESTLKGEKNVFKIFKANE